MMTQADDIASPRKVSAALAQIGAQGEANGVTTHALAAQMCPVVATESSENHAETVGRMAKLLNAGAKGSLEALAYGLGAGRRWYLYRGS